MRQLLSGQWEFRFDRDAAWRPIAVPGCWEMLGGPKNDPGPAWYRRHVSIPATLEGKRIWLRFEGVSYACAVFVNGREVGGHVGMWDGFRVEITDAVAPGETAELLVRVEKPASLTRGPDSRPVPGNYPQKQTLGGFLPYVWGHSFGGIWQDVWLETTGAVVIEDVCVRGNNRGIVRAEVRLSGEARVEFEVTSHSANRLRSRDHTWSLPASVDAGTGPRPGKVAATGCELVLETTVSNPHPWSPDSPTLYEARVRVEGDEQIVFFGLRSIRADGSTLLLNDQPVYPRMILSWGWYEHALHANPGREQVRRDFARLRSLGYNGVKLCLWVPPPYYFEIADELGLLLWLELPMWMPEVSPFFLEQTPVEYDRIVRHVRGHPSVVLYTLGCELDAGVRADFLEPLYRRTKALIGDALLRDNSGSGEAYGGLLNESAEFYDYHFYSDLQFLRPLLDHFAPRWRPKQPFLFGEFCDSDTWRDRRTLRAANAGELPWWARDDERENPQGARWQHDVGDVEQRLRASGFWDRQDELEAISHKQALLHRKFTLELVRTYREVSGYVVTGERDTPISTAGMWTGNAVGEERSKFDAAAFAAFNGDVVLSLGWDKRRAWVHGGDRAAYWATFGYTAGTTVRAHVIAGNGSTASGIATGRWSLELVAWASSPRARPRRGQEAHATKFAAGPFSGVIMQPGEVREVGIAELTVPAVDRPTKATLRAEVTIGGVRSANDWPIWFFPAPPAVLPPVRLIDPAGRLDGAGDWLAVPLAPGGAPPELDLVILATEWTDEVRRRVEAGGRAILLQGGRGPAGPLRTAPMPFWREAIKVVEPHPAWGDFPHEGWCDLHFFGMATDHGLESAALPNARPILSRVDARTAAVHDYAVELAIGAGRVVVSTLRFEGGLGEQPVGLSRNTCAAYLLGCWAQYLRALFSPPGNAQTLC